jgi:phage gp46-like protein
VQILPDIRLVQRGDFPYQTEVSVDWLLRSDGTLDDTEALASAVIVALGTDRLAASQDNLPDPDSTDRRGWWADLDAEEIWGGWPIGCRLWTLKRDKITGPGALQGSTLMRVEYMIREALQPFIDLRICSRIEIKAERVGKERIQALIRIYRGPAIAIDLRYQILWADIAAEPATEEFYTP